MDEARRQRLEDLLTQADLLLTQLVVFHQSTNPHHNARQQLRISELHRRLDVVERQLRMHAAQIGIDADATLSHIHRALAAASGRHNDRQSSRGVKRYTVRRERSLGMQEAADADEQPQDG